MGFSFLCIYHILNHPLVDKFSHIIIISCFNWTWKFSDGCILCIILPHQALNQSDIDIIDIYKIILHQMDFLHAKKSPKSLLITLPISFTKGWRCLQISPINLHLEPSALINGSKDHDSHQLELYNYSQTWFLCNRPCCHHNHGSSNYWTLVYHPWQ